MSARKPKGHTAVMADRARGEVEADTPEMALFRKLNFFPTEPWAGRAGGELIRRLDPYADSCWETACGQGHLAYALKDYFPLVIASDIHPFGYGQVFDFLGADEGPADVPDWIITNPPFPDAERFVREALERALRGVAMLCRSAWLDSHGRYPLFYGAQPLTVEAPFFERVTMTLGGRPTEGNGGSATTYSWFIWVKPETGLPVVAAAERIRREFGDGNLTLPIGVGTKARLTRRDDARLFGAKSPAPLFEGAP